MLSTRSQSLWAGPFTKALVSDKALFIMRELIYIVVENFYSKAINDILIGYHFKKFSENPAILEHHLQRITSFWELQLTGKTTQPLQEGFRLLYTHYQLPLKRGELGRWVKLFHETLDALESDFKLENDLEDYREIIQLTDRWKQRIKLFEDKFLQAPQLFKNT